jgi:hypothetical protein
MKLLLMLAASLVIATSAGAAPTMWINNTELAALPMSGTAWNNLSTAAATPTANWGTLNANNQDTPHGGYTFAAALYIARKSVAGTLSDADTTIRGRVRDQILAYKRTVDTDAEQDLSPMRTLGISRRLLAYVLAADLIDLGTHCATCDAEFKTWLATMPNATIEGITNTAATHGITLNQNFIRGAHNWGFFAGASIIAAHWYLYKAGTASYADSLAQDWALFQSYGDRSKYPTAAGTDSNYFRRTSGSQISWMCAGGTPTMTMIQGTSGSCLTTDANADCASTPPTSAMCPCHWPSGGTRAADLDGSVYIDICRTSSSAQAAFMWQPSEQGMEYQWNCLSGLFSQAEMLYRYGYTTAYSVNNNMCKRTMDFMVRGGWQPGEKFQHTAWIANYRYGTNYPLAAGYPTWNVGFSDYTHQPPTNPLPGTVSMTISPGVPTSYNVQLLFTVPGDNGFVGTAAYFDVRYSTTGPIDTEAEWDAATSDLGGWSTQNAPGGSAAQHDLLTLEDAGPGTYYFSIRYRDSSGNMGALSNSPSQVVPIP